ncbi:hypothetical protein [Arthrobacter woluwensis]|uniref:hypothetical protein n=1 Tax=Arthrobacter woluwensis TaxID=156980 RepID=UPI0011A272AE|nr:hypothetical protein [Arthrobacter woluwensis]
MSDADECLQCGESRGAVKAERLFCGIGGGGEYAEVDVEFERHRWADWKDKELAVFGVKSEARDKHRRTRITDFEWIDCDDTVRGHIPARPDHIPDFADHVGQCISCGKRAS